MGTHCTAFFAQKSVVGIGLGNVLTDKQFNVGIQYAEPVASDFFLHHRAAPGLTYAISGLPRQCFGKLAQFGQLIAHDAALAATRQSWVWTFITSRLRGSMGEEMYKKV